MNMKFILISLLALAATPAHAASDAFIDGNQLYDLCAVDRPGTTLFVMGAFDSSTAIEAARNMKLICLPNNVRASQVVDVACRHLKAHPESRQNSAATEILLGLQDAFPCK